jgi:hypothetical protein
MARNILLRKAMSVGRRLEQYFGPSYSWITGLKQRLFRAFNPLGRRHDHRLVYVKDKGDYVTTTRVSPDETERALLDGRYQRNLLSATKCRILDDGTVQFCYGQYVVDPADTDWQYHVYLFETPDGRTDVYGHRETSVREGNEHLTDVQTHGDPNGRAKAQLADSKIGFATRDFDTSYKPYHKINMSKQSAFATNRKSTIYTMTSKKLKNGLLGIGTTLLPAATTMLVKGQTIEGVILSAFAVACVVGYAVLDDRHKDTLLKYVNEDTLREGAEDIADVIEEQTDKTDGGDE